MSISTRRTAGVAFALGLGLLGAPAMAQDETNPNLHLRPERPWTQGTTHAANEVIGQRSGMDFHFLPPGPIVPGESQTPGVITVDAIGVGTVAQVFRFIPPPTNDLPPGPIRVQIRLLPPGPITPARVEVQILDDSDVTFLGPTGDPIAFCPVGPS